MRFVKRLSIICSIVAITVTLFHTAMLLSTNKIYNYVQNVIKEDIIITAKDDPLNYFSADSGSGPKKAAYSEFEFTRKKVWHNFNKGQMTIIFTEYFFDENNNLIHQFKDIEVVIYIEKQNGKWNVSKVERIS